MGFILRKVEKRIVSNMEESMTQISGVAELIHSAGIELLYLHPYSPNFNPIEKMWSKLKAYFHKLKIRSLDLPWAAIPNAFAPISASNATGWFHASGYC